MTDLISRQYLLNKLEERDCTLCVTEWDIKEAPTVDAVPVVRCKECEKRNTAKCPIYPAEYEDDFYSYGERRNDEPNTEN